MQPALHLTTKVLPGNKIEIEIPEREIGDTVDVFVVLPGTPKEKKSSVLKLIEESRRVGNAHPTFLSMPYP